MKESERLLYESHESLFHTCSLWSFSTLSKMTRIVQCEKENGPLDMNVPNDLSKLI